ncbi:BTAD domain-containing putative transcriptional regulator [Agromyces aurantiacus]|uniref:BTAD domain-containing putative transcriptional regulator n=1 Tax=Agromyces aurantiacus TaxID=165814 RepID=A0ABV9R0Y6_9MICO|nr:BTAD domain-containing putative transcriptional regulator [Agromyces aurantiacus]MBM7505901.1 DNA-binding SARP family transcriptional activator/WD40 repeat protein [Agromyces aurantiacus]
MSIRVLGPIEVDGGQELRPRDRNVLAALVVRHGRPVAPAEIAEAVWGDAPPASWPKQVQICMVRLRKVLSHDAIETVGDDGYRLVPERVEVDAARMEELVARGRQFLATGEPDRAATALGRALALVRGEPYRAVEHWAPAAAEAARLTEVVRSAEDDLLEARLSLGRHREVVGDARALVTQDPLRERRWAALALAQYRCGRQADALDSIQRARALLREQLGIDPGVALLGLERRILHQDPSLDQVAEPRPVSTACPYKGLAPLGPGDALFGRDREIAELLERSPATGLLVITGASGSGKSSLLRAGLVPALERRGRTCRVVVPDPTGSIEIPDATGPAPVLAVDQFEQLLLGSRPPDALAAQLSALAEAATSAGLVIIVVRADQLALLGVNPMLGRLAEENLHFVTAPTGAALREAIERPALDAGLRVEPGLVDLVVRDTEGEPGALPMMSHALAETWHRRDGNVLTVEAYRASGGIQGAVARTADRVYESVPDAQRRAIRSVLLRLVVPSPEGPPLRSRVANSALRGNPEWEDVVSRLIAARLVTAEDGALEISHDALVRAWPRLQSWLEEDAAGLRILRHLAAAAQGWEGLGRPETELYRGARLEAAQEYLELASPDLTPLEREFLDEAVRRSASERDAIRARAARDARQNRRLRVALAAAAALLVATVGAVAVAARQGADARAQGEQATIEAIVNRSLALRGTDRDIAALLAVEAHRRWPGDARVTSALLGTFTSGMGFLETRYVDEARSLRGAVIPATTRALVLRDTTRPAIIDLDTGRELASIDLPGGSEPVGGADVAVSEDGTRAAVLLDLPADDCAEGTITPAGTCGAYVVVDLANGTASAAPVVTPDGPGGIAISPDGQRVAVIGRGSGVVSTHDLAAPGTLAVVPGLPSATAAEGWWGITAVTFGPDGLVYAGSPAGPVRAIRPETGEVTATFDAPAGSSERHVAAGSDGTLIAVGTTGLVAFDTATGAMRWTAAMHGSGPDPCPWFAASVATERLYCGSAYGEIEERDRRTGLPTGRILDTQLGAVGDLSLSADGSELVAFGRERPAIMRWRLDGSGPVSTRIADGYAALDRFGYDDDTLLVARRAPGATQSADFTDFALWDVAADRLADDIRPDLDEGIEGLGWAGRNLLVGMDVSQLQFSWYDTSGRSLVDGPSIGVECDHLWPSAGGTRAYCGGLDGEVWTIDTAARTKVEPMLQVDGPITSVSATRGGERVVVTSRGDSGMETVVLDPSGRVLAGPLTDGTELTSVSLDGTLVGTNAGAITRYDLDTLEPLGELPGARGEVNSLQFSDDGRLLLATSNDQTASLYDVATGTRLGDPITTSAPLIYPAFLRPDGAALAVTDAAGVVLWDLDPDHLAAAACRVAGRDLTQSEWATFLAGVGEYRSTCGADTGEG